MEPTLQEESVIIYVGERTDTGRYHGLGRAVFRSGQVYDGQWTAGHMNGLGRVSFPDGVTYEGTFASDKIIGKGVYQWSNSEYEGEAVNGLRHGFGILTFKNSPAVYEGQWQFGKRSGRGTLYYNAEKTAYFEGDWQDDMKHGQGTSMYPSGNSYTGSWCADKRHGHGIMNWTTQGQVYQGDWADDLPNGLGEHVWQQGMPNLQVSNHAMQFMYNRYIGVFKDGMRHGEGSLWYASGARYEGQWEYDKKQGHGVYCFEDGSTFIGQFADDKPVLDAGTLQGAWDTLPSAVGTAVTGILTITATADARAAANAQAGAAGGSAAAATEMASGVPGFGPRVSTLQLYISDLLQECDAPGATYKAVGNLLVGHNTELRALYDLYCKRLSPLLSNRSSRNSWALQAGQLWELLRDSQLLCRHLQLQQACHTLLKALEPPPAVMQRRQQVLSSPAAAAVLHQPDYPYDPTIELLYRDFCELLVRVSAIRYPQLPCLKQQVQQVITQHLLPLLGPGPGRTGGCRPSFAVTSRSNLVPQGSSATVASSGTASQSAASSASAAGYACASAPVEASVASALGTGQLQQEDLVLYLQRQVGALQELYAAFWNSRPLATQDPGKSAPRQQVQLMAGHNCSADGVPSSSCWMWAPVTVRQVVAVLQQTAVLERWHLAAADVATLLLEGVMTVVDPVGFRARMDEANLDPADVEQQQQSSNQHASEATAYQDLSYWMDAPLLLAELLWGLVRCAAVLPAHQVLAQTTGVHPPAEKQADRSADSETVNTAEDAEGSVDLLTRTQVWLEGNGGLLNSVLGLKPDVHEHRQVQPEDPAWELDSLQQQAMSEQDRAACTPEMPDDAQMEPNAYDADGAASSRPSTQSMASRPQTVESSDPTIIGLEPS